MSKSNGSSGSGCILWLILIALVAIILLLAGFQPAQAGVYAAAGVAGLAGVVSMLPCGLICCGIELVIFLVLVADIMNGLSKELHRRDDFSR